MRKKKFSLEALSHILPVLDEVEQRGFVGGGDGTYDSPYTSDEFDNWQGLFPGGVVEGLGLVQPDITVYSYQYYNSDGTSTWTQEIYLNENFGSYYSNYFSFNDNNDGTFSKMQLAANYATQNSQEGSIGYCARYVRMAIEKGAGINLSGHPLSACDYDTFLQTKGFVVVSKNSLSSPKVGDVAVFEATEGHSDGHIAIFNGTNWVSDFVQNSFWVSKAYQNANNYTILRLK